MYHLVDLVLRYPRQIKPGEASKFHRQWQGPFRVVTRVIEVTYLIKKVGVYSRRFSVAHFNNLRLYKRKPLEGGKRKKGACIGFKSPQKEDLEEMNGEWAHDCMTNPSKSTVMLK